MTRPKILSQGAGDNASYGLLARAPLERLAALGQVEHRSRLSGEVLCSDIMWADMLVFVQSQENIDIKVMAMARYFGKPVVMVSDDDYLSIPPGHMKTRHFEYPHRKRNYLEFIRRSDLMLVTTGHLAGIFEGYRGKSVLWFDDLPVADELIEAAPNFSQDGLFRFVYATCRANYRHLSESGAAEAIKKICATSGDKARFIFMGGGEDLGFDPGCCQFIPRLPPTEFYRKFAALPADCGLAPLMPDPYSLGKSDLKYREYAARALPGIYSNVPLYADSVEHASTGLLTENGQGNWYRALSHMLEHRDEARQMALAARAVAKQRFTMQRWAEHWRHEIINSVLLSAQSAKEKRGDKAHHFIYEFHRGRDYIWRRVRTFWYNAFYLDRYPAIAAFKKIFRRNAGSMM